MPPADTTRAELRSDMCYVAVNLEAQNSKSHYSCLPPRPGESALDLHVDWAHCRSFHVDLRSRLMYSPVNRMLRYTVAFTIGVGVIGVIAHFQQDRRDFMV